MSVIDILVTDAADQTDKTCWDTGKEYSGTAIPSLVVGANVAGFQKVADAMRAQGDWW